MTDPMPSALTGLRSYLGAPVPVSTGQARAQQFVRSWRRFARNRSALAGAVFLTLLVLVAVFAPWIATHDPFAQSLAERLQPFSSRHWLGTDELGRDMFSRLVHGARITFYIALLTAAIVGPVGLAVGAIAGYFGGWIDLVLMRVVDVFLSFPSLVLALAFVTALGPGLENAVIAISLSMWPPVARLARAETLIIRGSDYVAAMRLQGASSWRIIWSDIMPMCLPSVVVRVTLNVATIILTAAGLGFLGLGAQPPSPEWGAMLSTGREYMMGSWWVAAVPGLAILFASLAVNLVGDGLRDVLDPHDD